MGPRWIKIASIYFILGIAIGIFMSASLQLEWAARHAHVNLAGWASMWIIGLTYTVFPEAGRNMLVVWNFWLYNIGLPILLISMFMIQMEPPFEAWISFVHIFTYVGGTMVAIGVILFIINIFKNAHDSTSYKNIN